MILLSYHLSFVYHESISLSWLSMIIISRTFAKCGANLQNQGHLWQQQVHRPFNNKCVLVDNKHTCPCSDNGRRATRMETKKEKMGLWMAKGELRQTRRCFSSPPGCSGQLEGFPLLWSAKEWSFAWATPCKMPKYRHFSGLQRNNSAALDSVRSSVFAVLASNPVIWQWGRSYFPLARRPAHSDHTGDSCFYANRNVPLRWLFLKFYAQNNL